LGVADESATGLGRQNYEWSTSRSFSVLNPAQNPFATENTTPYEFPGSKKLHEPAHHRRHRTAAAAAILAIQQIIMLAELAVNRVLDNVGVTLPATHR
jgi:hypothetical protein